MNYWYLTSNQNRLLGLFESLDSRSLQWVCMRQLLALCGCLWLKDSWYFIPKSLISMFAGVIQLDQTFCLTKILRWSLSHSFPLWLVWKSFEETYLLHDNDWIPWSSPVALSHTNCCPFKDGCGKVGTSLSPNAAAWVSLMTSIINFIWE